MESQNEPTEQDSTQMELEVKKDNYKFERIFISLILNSWRQKRAESNRLEKEIICMNSEHLSMKCQTNVFNRLYKHERKQSKDFKQQVEALGNEFLELKELCDLLTNKIISLNVDLTDLREVLNNKDSEYNELSNQLTTAYKDFENLGKNHEELKEQLEGAQTKIQRLLEEKKKLVEEVKELKDNFAAGTEDFDAAIAAKDREMENALKQLELYENELTALKLQEADLQEYSISHDKIKEKLYQLREVLHLTDTDLENSERTVKAIVKNSKSQRPKTEKKNFWRWLDYLPYLLTPMQNAMYLAYNINIDRY